jgi:7-cyano-7-deazaguanine synthase
MTRDGQIAVSDSLPANAAVAVLSSGGLDSAILLAESAQCHEVVYPVYVRTGLAWEPAELAALRSFLAVLSAPQIGPIEILDLPVTDLYGGHWSLTGQGVPGAGSADKDVYLPGRNVLLLAKSILWCHLRGVPAIGLGTLEANPFPDATPGFFRAFQETVNQAIGGHVEVRRPYAALSKTEVVRRGRNLPLEYTLSCMRPVDGRHCGACNKCAERRRAFAAAGLADPTEYDARDVCIA